MPTNSKQRAPSAFGPRAASTRNSDGAKPGKRRKRRKDTAPHLSEKAKKLALKAFRLTYEAHHGKSP
jgi:hypothetical protein